MESVLSLCKINSKIKGNRWSAHLIPGIANDILRLCKHFPIWTSVMQSHFHSPYDVATSASIEGDFKDLKCHILHFERKPMTADRFVINHFNSINSSTKLFRSSQLRSEASYKKKKIEIIPSPRQLKSSSTVENNYESDEDQVMSYDTK